MSVDFLHDWNSEKNSYKEGYAAGVAAERQRAERVAAAADKMADALESLGIDWPEISGYKTARAAYEKGDGAEVVDNEH